VLFPQREGTLPRLLASLLLEYQQHGLRNLRGWQAFLRHDQERKIVRENFFRMNDVVGVLADLLVE
jgi:hypothetical protein